MVNLKCPGVGRDKDNPNALQFYFSRPVSDDELRFLQEVVQRAVAGMPDKKPTKFTIVRRTALEGK